MFSVLIILMITLTSQNVQSKVIIVNTSEGTENAKCCVEGKCPCSSLSAALQNVDNNTIINITSEEVTIKDNITIVSANLKNITITSQVFTNITCYSITSSNCFSCLEIYCDSCDDVIVSGITWRTCILDLGIRYMADCTIMDTVIIAVSRSMRFEHLLSESGSALQINNVHNISHVNLTILESTMYSINVSDHECLAQWNITITNSTIFENGFPIGFSICADVFYGMHMVNVNVSGVRHGIELELSAMKGDVSVSLLSSVFIHNGNALYCTLTAHSDDSNVSVLIRDTEFINNYGFDPFLKPAQPILFLSTKASVTSTFTLYNINFNSNFFRLPFAGTLFIVPESHTEVYMTNVNFITTNYNKHTEEEVVAAVYIKITGFSNEIIFNHCDFISNTFSGGAKVIYIHSNHEYTYPNSEVVVDNCNIFNNTIYDGGKFLYISGPKYRIIISNSVFDHNTVDDYIITADIDSTVLSINASTFVGNTVKYSIIFLSLSDTSVVWLRFSQFINNTGNCLSLSQAAVLISSSNFTNNIESCVYLFQSDLRIDGNVVFENNTANKGAALYIDKWSSVTINHESNIHFFKNSASLGGAIFVDLSISCFYYGIGSGVVFDIDGNNAEVTFKDNVAGARYSGDALYFSISKDCKINTNASDPTSLMYIPYHHFNYSQLNSTDCCDISCSHLHNIRFPAITSPRYLILCGNNVKQLNDTTYFIGNTVLKKPAVFQGSVTDYFKKLSQLVQFSVNCTTCPNDVELSSSDSILVDSAFPLSLMFSGNKLNCNINVTIIFTPFLDVHIQAIETQVILELVPCFNHLGYTYNRESNGCACYNVSVVKCSDRYNEIEDDYWIGNISSQPTTSLCPTRYCSFVHRNKFTLGYSELPNTADAQCNDHRTGTACGQCSSDYTLTYGTTDCISENDCSTIITVVVIISTCLYWLIVVVGVFTLLYYNRRIPLGYTYGIIYYYSMVGILFSNNLYVSESAFLFISVLSSFTQLSPQFLGKLCLVKGLSGIDQLFIHYVHPVAVSLLVVVFVIAAKFSPKLSAFFSRCRIIRIICLLLLLSYTSIASTSLQLLRPLTFTDIAEVYTYTSPSIQYFHDRHALYGVVAIVSELIAGIGLPLLLLLEPFANKKINFIKIKPLLDEFQDCYKDKRKYRWFASYYLICRQVILLIVFIGNSNYNGMLFFLQITCIIIATIHMWVQPYKSASLNIFDGLILQIMVVSVAINTFTFLQPVATELVLIVVIFPLFVMCAIGIKQIIMRKLRGGEYTALPGDDARFVNQLVSYVTAIEQQLCS